MKPLVRTAVWTIVIASFCSAASIVGTFYHLRYRSMPAEIETRLIGAEMRIDNLERQQLASCRSWARLSTTDMPEPEEFGMPPHFRIPVGSTAVHEFELHPFKYYGPVLDCWLADWTPLSEIAKFEKFHLSPGTNAGQMRLVVQLKPGASVNMEFRAVALERW